MRATPAAAHLGETHLRHREGVLLVLLATVAWSAGGVFTRLLPFGLRAEQRQGRSRRNLGKPIGVPVRLSQAGAACAGGASSKPRTALTSAKSSKGL